MIRNTTLYCTIVLAWLLLLVSCAVPPPTTTNTTEIEGTLAAVTTCCEGGDVQFWLAGYERGFYINRAIEAGFDLEAFKAEVSIGDTVFITAFNGWLPDEPGDAGVSHIPSAEIRTAAKVHFSRMPDTQ